MNWRSFIRSGYQKRRELAHVFYQQIGRVPCPAFRGSHVYFSARGFNHLIRKKSYRPKNEQKLRFYLLRYAEQIILDSDALFTHRFTKKKIKKARYGVKKLETVDVHEWTFHKTIGKWKIKLVVRQEGAGQIHFNSIMHDDGRTNQ